MTARAAASRFYLGLSIGGALYIALIVALLVGDLFFTTPRALWDSLQAPEIRYAIRLSIVSCLVTTVLSLWVAVPTGYVLARTRFRGQSLLDVLLDIPIVLPPLVLGLSLLILFQTPPGKWLERQTTHRMGFLLAYLVLPTFVTAFSWLAWRTWQPTRPPWHAALLALAVLVGTLLVVQFTGSLESRLQKQFGTPITYAIPSVILAQFTVSCAFAIRTMRVAFEQISPRPEQVALTLGCTRWQAFWYISIPEAWRGIVSAAAIAFARALGEFGPILIFSGATRLRTEVLSTTVFLELSVGKLEAAIAVSLLMVLVAMLVLLLMRSFGMNKGMV